MKVFYSDRYTVDLPEGHRFPMSKYKLVRESLLREGVLEASELFEPRLPTRDEMLAAHTSEYFDTFCDGTIDPGIMRRIGFPWSESLVNRSLASVGGAMDAADAALDPASNRGVSGNLAGGTHHAFADAGEGYCVFNDVAVAVLNLLKHKKISRAAIVDLDVHQGNGNAGILGGNPDVYILSLHGAKNYPFRKVPSTVDVDLPDGADDELYLASLRHELPKVFAFKPDLIFYQAGVDPLKEDKLGRLSLSLAGLAARDRMLLSMCNSENVPVSLALGGGYADPISLTVAAHVQTYKIVKEIFPN
ncbi:MAG: histone deacetylase [Rhizobacter sp.]|nr:histone deacetylase [Chlorobiales bacterium]